MKAVIKRGRVKTVSNGVLITRFGRGYSKNELVQSGVTNIHVARKRKIPVDPLRKTSHVENIEQLKTFLGKGTSGTTRKLKQKTVRKSTK